MLEYDDEKYLTNGKFCYNIYININLKGGEMN